MGLEAPPHAARSVIRAEQLSRRFGEFVAVKQVSFEVYRGEIFGYLGANGAGKSTTIRMLCGLLAPSDGRAWVAEVDVARSPEAVKRAIGYMSQKFSLYQDLQVAENLEFFGGAYGLRGSPLRLRIDAVLEQVQLLEYRRTRTGDLPGGLRQRVALASALLHGPSILFLDEPTAGVDPGARREFWRLIRTLSREGTTIFVTTHYMDEAEYCHRIGLMVDGELRALDTPAELKRRFVPGTLLQLETPQMARAILLLRQLPGVLDVQPFGAAAHVRLDPDRLAAPELAAQLRQGGCAAVTLQLITASLEDVFLTVVEG